MFLNLPGIVFQPISADVTRQTIKEHFLLRYGIKLLAHTGLTCSDATCEMSRQPTLAKFGFKKRIDHRGLQQDINLLDFVAKTPKKFTCSTLLLLHKTSPLVFGSIYIFVHLFFCLSFNVQ